jgi:integrase
MATQSTGCIWLSQVDTHNSIFERPLRNLCADAKVEPFGYHDIRHTVAKYLNDFQRVSLKKVQQVLRHRRQSTTEIHVEGNYTDTKEAIGLLEVKNLENLPLVSREISRKE